MISRTSMAVVALLMGLDKPREVNAIHLRHNHHGSMLNHHHLHAVEELSQHELVKKKNKKHHQSKRHKKQQNVKEARVQVSSKEDDKAILD
jgi:hypothetical protein